MTDLDLDAIEAEPLREPAQLVLLAHATRPQRALVQRREAQRVGQALAEQALAALETEAPARQDASEEGREPGGQTLPDPSPI